MSLLSRFFSYTLILLTCSGVHGQEDWYAKQKYASVLLIRVVPRTQTQLDFLESLKNERRGLLMQFWRHPDKPQRHVDVWVSEVSVETFKRLLAEENMPYKVISRDIMKETGKPDISMNNIEDYDDIYQKIDDITSEIRRLAVTYKEAVSVDVIGKSYEDRPIYRVLVHQNASHAKPILFVLCGSHAREWLGIAACQYFLRKLVFDQNYDEEIKSLLNEHDVAIVPLLNPDGYKFTKRSRMWRKSRSQTQNGRCRGVDINRNFDYRWGGGGSSPDACEEIYCGEKPFSEKEPLALARHLYKIRRKLVAFMDIHTYGQLWMSPWGFTTGFPRDYIRHDYALRKIQRAMLAKNGMSYKIGRSATTLAATSGNALDWVYGRLNIVHSYATELRPHSDVMYNGFEESGREISPSGEDLLVGVQTISNLILRENKHLEKLGI